MVKFKDTDFLHAGPRIKVLEGRMLGQRQLTQMIEAGTLEEAYKIAADAGIGAGVPVEDYERALAENLRETYAFLESLSGEHTGFLDLFRYEYDALNLKILIKSQALDKDTQGALVEMGTVPAGLLREEYREEKLESAHPLLAAAAVEATDLLARTRDPQAVDLLMDKAMLAAMLDTAMEYDCGFLHRLVRSRIDIANLRCLVRVMRMDRDLDFFKQTYIPGGTLAPEPMQDAFAKGADGVAGYLEGSPYAERLEPAIPAVRAGGSLTQFEKLCDDLTIRQLEELRLVPFGVELLIAHALAKEAELKAVRVVLASRMAGVAPELIKERLRETYA